MAQIPSGQKFHTVPAGVQTIERGSALANSQREIYTMQDIIDTAGGGSGSSYVVIKADSNPSENGAALEQAYVDAATYEPNGNPISSFNQFYIVLAPGYYELSTTLIVNLPWVNIVSMTGLRDVFIMGNTLSVTAHSVYIQGIDTASVDGLSFSTSGTSSAQTFENCRGGEESFGAYTGAYGTYINCDAGYNSFGANSIAGGVFINCTAQWNSFGGGFGGTQASGVFKNCTSSYSSFGGYNGSANGTFEYCVGGNNSFGGGPSGNASGIFSFCKLTAGSFPVPGGSGKFVYCHANGIPYNAGFIAQNNL